MYLKLTTPSKNIQFQGKFQMEKRMSIPNFFVFSFEK